MTIKAFHKTKFESKSFRLCSRVSEAVRVYASERVECKAFESPMETKVQSTLRSARWEIFIQTYLFLTSPHILMYNCIFVITEVFFLVLRRFSVRDMREEYR